jgi:hypothetical protein
VILAKLNVQRRYNMREVYIGANGVVGVHHSFVIPLRFSQSADQSGAAPEKTVYNVTPETLLDEGEYVLMIISADAPLPYGGIQATFFDLGVD